MAMAVEQMLKSRSEHREKSDPLVGAVLVSANSEVLGAEHRGGLRIGVHAEYALIDRILQGRNLEGSSLFVTLEPCIKRSPDKTPCANRIVQARIARVVVGMPDPDPDILGRGIDYLLKNGVQVTFFDSDIAAKIRDENRGFIEDCAQRGKLSGGSEEPFEGASATETEILGNIPIDSLSVEAMRQYLETRKINLKVPSEGLWSFFEQSRFVGRTSDKRFAPTIAGVLLFGVRPADVLPQARISLYVKGGLLKEFEGPLVAFRNALEEFFNDQMPRVTRIRGLDRIETYCCPIVAFREAAFNAVAHRDYRAGRRVHIDVLEDRILIKSPGPPLKPLSISKLSEFNAPPYSRNPHLAAALNHLGWIEEKGSGLVRMRQAMEADGLPAPEFSLDNEYVVVQFRDARQGRRDTISPNLLALTPTQHRVYLLLSKRKHLTTTECAKELRINVRNTRRVLQSLVEAGVAERFGAGPKIAYRPAQF